MFSLKNMAVDHVIENQQYACYAGYFPVAIVIWCIIWKHDIVVMDTVL